MNILEIYKKYNIMPILANHQLTVAAVASTICDNTTLTPTLSQREREDVVAACLLHDMGNIIKFDLSITNKLHPGTFKQGDLEYWEKVKQDYINKYGRDEHLAAVEIARELKVGARVIELVDCIGFNTGKINAESEDFGRKICAYSDMRVGPPGVISLEERLADLRVRYNHKFHQVGGNEEKRVEFENGLRQIEQQIFEHCNIRPGGITEASVSETKEKLKDFKI